MRVEEVTCDGCGAALTTRTNSVDYRLVLASEGKPGYMMIYPAIERAHHFCALACLDLWRARERHRNKLWREFWDRWKTEHGTDHGGGMWVYPELSEDLRAKVQSEFESAALAAFPMKRTAAQNGQPPKQPKA